MMHEAKTQKRRGGINQIPKRMRKLFESRWDLRQLIYWMEHDRRLGAPPDRIFLLKQQLDNIEHRIVAGQG